MTECTCEQLEFHRLGRRAVVARSDGGVLLLREVEARTVLLAGVGERFTDYRDPELIEHSVGELVAQRMIGLAPGYEDLTDPDHLWFDAPPAPVAKRIRCATVAIHQAELEGPRVARTASSARSELGSVRRVLPLQGRCKDL